MGAMMPLTMRPTGGHSPVYADRQDWTILDDGKPVGRVPAGQFTQNTKGPAFCVGRGTPNGRDQPPGRLYLG